MIRWYVDNRRSHGGRRPQRNCCRLAGGTGRAAGPGRPPVCQGGATTARPRAGSWAAGGPAPQELLDDRRARRPDHPRWPAAPAGWGGLGSRRRPRRCPRLSGGAPRRGGRGAGGRRDRRSQERQPHRRGATPVHGTAGQVDNAQVAVYLAYTTAAGHGVIDRELYLPQGWIDDPARCQVAGVPDQVGFATKPELARMMLERALEAGVPAGWVTADEV